MISGSDLAWLNAGCFANREQAFPHLLTMAKIARDAL
jgi:hypothetical protein